jgi:hypothetical protein
MENVSFWLLIPSLLLLVGSPFVGAEMASTARARDGRSIRRFLPPGWKATSGAPIIRGTSQLPNPPKVAGLATKNNMMRPWAVLMTL